MVIVDESHLLDADQLEELRLLTNPEMDSASPFALLLLGQPRLRARLRLGRVSRHSISARRCATRWHR